MSSKIETSVRFVFTDIFIVSMTGFKMPGHFLLNYIPYGTKQQVEIVQIQCLLLELILIYEFITFTKTGKMCNFQVSNSICSPVSCTSSFLSTFGPAFVWKVANRPNKPSKQSWILQQCESEFLQRHKWVKFVQRGKYYASLRLAWLHTM